MAERSNKTADKTLSIVGQSSSGKTNLLASLLHNTAANEDLLEGPDRVSRGQFIERPGDDRREDTEVLQRHFGHMLRGLDHFEGAATEAVRRYRCRLEFTPPDEPPPARAWGMGRSRSASAVGIDFDIVDGRGGDVAPDALESELDERTKARRQLYRDALQQSSAALICMPVQESAHKNTVVRNFIQELDLMKEAKRTDTTLPRLKRVAICFTKYEAEFLAHGPGAIDVASDPDVFRERMSDHASLQMFGPLVEANHSEHAFDLMFFPVSSYGFISQGGAPNFYEYPEAPGLKTRAVDPIEDYDNPGLQDYEDHFPVAVNDAAAKKLWWPYNVAPPFLFALTGRVTGPLALTPEEIGFGRVGA